MPRVTELPEIALVEVVNWLRKEEDAVNAWLDRWGIERYRSEFGFSGRVDEAGRRVTPIPGLHRQWVGSLLRPRNRMLVYGDDDAMPRDFDAPLTDEGVRIETVLTQYLLARPFGPFGGDEESARVLANMWVREARARYLDRRGGRQSKDEATAVATTFLSDLAAPTHVREETVWLGDVVPLECAVDDFQLRALTAEELGFWERHVVFDPPERFLRGPSGLPAVVLSCETEVPWGISSAPSRIVPLLEALILLDCTFSTVGNLVDVYRSVVPGLPMWRQPHDVRWKGHVKMGPDVLSQAVPLGKTLESMSSKSQLALRRLMLSTSRDLVEDKIVDIVVCLEAVLTASREQLAYQFRTTGALLLGDSPVDRKEIELRLKRAYGDRSGIVHQGHAPKMSSQEVDELTDLARRAVKHVAEHGDIDHDRLLYGDAEDPT